MHVARYSADLVAAVDRRVTNRHIVLCGGSRKDGEAVFSLSAGDVASHPAGGATHQLAGGVTGGSTGGGAAGGGAAAAGAGWGAGGRPTYLLPPRRAKAPPLAYPDYYGAHSGQRPPATHARALPPAVPAPAAAPAASPVAAPASSPSGGL